MKTLFLFLVFLPIFVFSQSYDTKNWKLITTAKNELDKPFPGDQQTTTLVTDVDNDGIPEIVLTERTQSPSVVMYKKSGSTWERYIIDNEPVKVEAGATQWDITGDGYMDIVFGGDGRSNEVWWWENPYPNWDKKTPWKRRNIKIDGQNKHHDVLFGDFNGDGKGELVFWNQGAKALMMAKIPGNVKNAIQWEYSPIYVYSSDSEMEQHGHGNYPPWKRVNEHEGLVKIDVDGDSIQDIVGGGIWFKYDGNDRFIPNIVDARYTFSRVAAGQLIKGGRPELVMTPGDGKAPMMLYEWRQAKRPGEGTWFAKIILNELWNAHSLDIIDFNGDGNHDIFVAEMRISGENPDAKMRILLGDGKGNFDDYVISTGFDNHESRIADLNGDGSFDVVGKPYNWETPGLDIWINTRKK